MANWLMSCSAVYNPVISGWCIPTGLNTIIKALVYNPVISGWCIPSTGIQFPESAGRHLSHNKPANRVFLLPRRPCISTGVNSGYTVRTRFYFLGNVCNHCTLSSLGFRQASARKPCADLRTARPVPVPHHAWLPVLRWRYLRPPECVQPSPPYTLSYR